MPHVQEVRGVSAGGERGMKTLKDIVRQFFKEHDDARSATEGDAAVGRFRRSFVRLESPEPESKLPAPARLPCVTESTEFD